MSRPVTFKSIVGRHLSFANAVRGRMSDSHSSVMKGWRCRECGSWDVYGATLGAESNYVIHKHQDEAEC